MKKNIINIINEELGKFDFLGNDEYVKKHETFDLFSNEDLQKQFICDSLLNRNKVKILKVDNSTLIGNWNSDNVNDINEFKIEYSILVEYRYDTIKESIKFYLDFKGDYVGINVSGTYSPETRDVPSYKDFKFDDIDWEEINVLLYDEEGYEIKFIAFYKAPKKIQELFIREFIEGFIESKSSMNIDIPTNKSDIYQYC